MGKDLHECIVTGRVTKDPEMRYTPAGLAVTNVSLAVADDYFDKKTEKWVNRANFFRFTFFGDSGERLAQKTEKGQRLLIRYSPRNNNYEKDGRTVYQDQFIGSVWQAIDRTTSNSDQPEESRQSSPPPTTEDDVPF